MYKRKIEAVLEAWKNEPKRKPLVVKGVRQCGKTSSVKQFAYANYEHVVYMDFREDPALVSLFNNSLKVDYLTMTISAALPDAEFVPGKTCLILDEIQDCPRARGALKFLCLDGRYDVICTGSLLECKANTGNAKSLQTVLKHPEKYHVYSALKFGDYNVGRNGALLTLPFYMWYLLG